MNLLETLGILFIAIVALNAIIGLFAMKNAIPENNVNEFAQDVNFSSLKVSKI